MLRKILNQIDFLHENAGRQNGTIIKNMITAMQLRERLNEVPFKPFRITMSDGRTLSVPNHDVALVKKNTILVGIQLDAGSFAEKYIECAILHIASIEDIVTTQPA
jgi:hypothetical protein